MTDANDQFRERRTDQADIAQQVRENKAALEKLRKELEEIQELLEPVAEFYKLMRSDMDTLGRFGRGLRSFLAWGAAVIISAGVLIVWVKNGFKLPG